MIYDRVLDATLWPQTISSVGDATNCFAGMLAVTDPKSFGGSVCHTWNCDPIWLARLPDHAEEIHIPESFLARSR